MKRLLRNRVAVGLTLLAGTLLFAEVPQWWVDRGIVDTNTTPNDYAPVNQGQAKHVAHQAYLEFDQNLTTDCSAISNLVYGFSETNNYLPINLGQLKYLAVPFYDLLWTNNYTNAWPEGMIVGPYPWSSSSNSSADYALANIGQLKYLFSFNPSTVATDFDEDGLPDWWEKQYGLDPLDATGDNGADGDPDGDGWTNLEEFINGTNPKETDGGLPLYSTGFEPAPAEGYVLGALDGQDDWSADASVTVQNQVKLEQQAAQIGGFDVSASRQVTSSAKAVESTFSFYFSGSGVFPPAKLPESASTLLCYDPSQGLMALDGDGVGGGAWALVPDSLLTDQWVEITVVLNYARPDSPEKTWGVFISGHGSLTGLGFKTDSADKLNSIQIEGDAEIPNYLDNLSVQEISTVPW